MLAHWEVACLEWSGELKRALVWTKLVKPWKCLKN